MDFSKFDSWVKVPPRTYKEYEDDAGEWDELTQSYHAHVKDICIKRKPRCASRIGIVFVENIYALDVWRISYAAAPPDCALSNMYAEEDAGADETTCANCFAPEKHILGYFTDMDESFGACDKAAVEIAEEVDDALENNRPSLYFSTYFLTNNYWPFGGERPEGDTGGTYAFEYAPEENEVEEKPHSNMSFLEFMAAVASGTDPESVEVDTCLEDYVEKLFYDEIAGRMDYVECCDVEVTFGNDSDILLFSTYKFDKEFKRGHEKTLKELTAKKEDCLNILTALQKCNMAEETVVHDESKTYGERARELLKKSFEDYVWGGVLLKIYARLGENCFV